MTYRPQEFSLARNIAGWQELRTDIFNGCARGNAAVTIEYEKSFDAQAINRYFFGANSLIFSGSRVPNRGACDILADYFGLPTNFQSKLAFCPHIRNIITDLDFYWNLDGHMPCDGFNLHVYAPIVNSSWALNPCETIIDPGTAAYPAGYMSNARIDRNQLPEGALDVLSCGQTFGDLAAPLQYGRIARNALRETKLSDILVALGYTFVRNKPYLFGINAQVIIPTGTRSDACYLFEPQIGNGHHWALGAGLTARYDLFDNGCDIKISACFDATVQHLFKTRQRRSYDLKKNGPGSRYALLEDMVGAISAAQNFSPVPFVDPLQNQYITRLFYASHATTFDSYIKINVQADVVAKLTIDYCDWNIDLGYNFWGRSHETLVCRDKLTHKFYGFKGDAQVYGFISLGGPLSLSIPINPTQSQATLHAGQGAGNTTNNFINANADNAALIYNVGLAIQQTDANSVGADTGVTALAQTNGSDQAIVLNDSDIDDCSGLSPRAFSNKVFGSIGHTWSGCGDIRPFIAFGGEGEFAGKQNDVKTAISQWGVWIKGGLNY